ncbi:uncharacterized protein LOC128853374 [Cuculus canorus]|uniref:uncharacterized protein LOC128853374 n=1 Tax=Cuculus canorus TaxID=55661 RepID=UPI0023AA5472|nr:uncharacterized protein LOC128853374 [Cuculus canorus]
MHTALRRAGRSPEDVAWLFLPGACSNLLGSVYPGEQLSLPSGEEGPGCELQPGDDRDELLGTPEMEKRVGAELPVQRSTPRSLQKASCLPYSCGPQNHGMGWKGPFQVTRSNPSAEAGTSLTRSEPKFTSVQPWVVLLLTVRRSSTAIFPSFPGAPQAARAAHPPEDFPAGLQERAATVWSLARERCSGCSPLPCHLPGPRPGPYPMRHHLSPPLQRHRGHRCGMAARLRSAGIGPGCHRASDGSGGNSWGPEQHQLQRQTQVELSFGAATAEICRCLFQPQTAGKGRMPLAARHDYRTNMSSLCLC